MSEEQAVYDADKLAEAGYVAEAVEMLGAGYQPAATIESPRVVRELTNDGLREYKAWGWVKVSAKFIAHIRVLRGAKLAIWQCISLSIDETGKCSLSIKELSAMTGYSHTEVIDSVKELREMGYLGVDKTGKKNIYTPEFAARGNGNDPTESVKKLDSTVVESSPAYQYESSPSEENSVPSSKELKELINGEEKMHTPLGAEQISYAIKKALNDANIRIPNSAVSIIRDALTQIDEGAPVNKNIKTEAIARGISKSDLALSEKIADAFGFDAMPLTEAAFEVYRWIEQQEPEGQTISMFVSWAKKNEDGKYIRMYRKDPSNIKVDWDRAFSEVRSSASEVRF